MRSDAHTRELFESHLGALREWLLGNGGEITMTSVLEDLLRTPKQWARDAILELLRGDQGMALRVEAVEAVCSGFQLNRGYVNSFVTACVSLDQYELLRSVAALGLPDLPSQLAAVKMYDIASTSAGGWLDLLCSTDAVHASQEGRRTLLMQLCALSGTDARAASLLADLLLEHDPTHSHISHFTPGSKAHAVYMHAVLGRKLAYVTSHPDSAAAVPSDLRAQQTRRKAL